MKRRAHKRLRGCLAVLLLAGFRAGAQHRYLEEEPQLLTLHLDQASTGVFAEGYEQSTSIGGVSSRQTRLFIGPSLGLGFSGSVYHPNFLQYRLTSDGSVGWLDESFSGASHQSDSQVRYIGSFSGEAHLLDNKPLNGRLFGSHTLTYQDYDFFNRIYIDQWRYGAGARYSAGPFALSSTVYRETQDSTGYGTPLKSDSTTATVEAVHNRSSGSTALNASVQSFSRDDYGVASSGNDYTVGATDSEDFGSRKQFHSLVNLNLNRFENASVPSDLYNALGNLRAEHTDNLSSYYSLNYSRNTFGGDTTDNLSGHANLEHKLYESLTSDLNLTGYRSTASSGSAQQDSWQFGGGPALNYTKHLSASSTLTAYEGLSLLHTEIQSSGGVIPVIDEQGNFGTGGNGAPPGSVILHQPFVIKSTIRITGITHLPPEGYTQGFDYDVIPNGQLTIIQRRPGSTMPNSVLISYSFEASPSGSYDTLNNVAGIRLDFFDHHWSLFARFNMNRNYGNAGLTVQNLNDYVFGTDGTWRFLRAGAEYEIYDSNLSPFNALRFFQTFTFQPEEGSTLSLNFNETFRDYVTASRKEQDYTAILRYSRALTSHLGFNVDLGANQRVGPGVNETMAVFRPNLQYTYGKFSANIGYDFGYDEYLSTQKRVQNMGYIRIRKDF